MKLTVLISCMHQKDASIIARSNIQTDVVIINQCDEDSTNTIVFMNKNGEECICKMINTTSRGLSKSRNMAINAAGDVDVCVICDDDEVFPDNYEEVILSAYSSNPNLSVACFAIDWEKREYPKIKQKMNFRQILRTSSQQITFLRDKVLEHNILFDEKMGSGTGNGGGEENKFLLDCRKVGLQMIYYPQKIATICKGESQWFHGYTEKFFRNQGWSVRRLLGTIFGYAYIWYYAFKHYRLYKRNIGFFSAIVNMHKGYLEKR